MISRQTFEELSSYTTFCEVQFKITESICRIKIGYDDYKLSHIVELYFDNGQKHVYEFSDYENSDTLYDDIVKQLIKCIDTKIAYAQEQYNNQSQLINNYSQQLFNLEDLL